MLTCKVTCVALPGWYNKFKNLYSLRTTILIQAFFAIGFITCLQSQEELHFKQLSLDQGASSAWIFDVAEDSLGYIWFGGHTGLDRYDGKRFKSFKHDPDDERTIAENQIYRIHVTHDNNLLLSTLGGGLNHYNSKSGKITRFPIQKDIGTVGFRPHKSNIIALEDKTYVCIATRTSQVMHFDADGQLFGAWSIGYYRNKQWIPENNTTQILEFQTYEGKIILLGQERIYLFDLHKGLVEEHKQLGSLIERHIGSPPKFLTGLFINDQEMLVSLESGHLLLVNIFNLTIEQLLHLSSKDHIVKFGHALDTGVWLISASDRLFHFHPKTSFIHEKKLNFKGLEAINFMCIHQSKDSIIWIGTFNHGVLYHNPSENNFSYTSIYKNANGVKTGDRFIYSTIDPLEPIGYTRLHDEPVIVKTNLISGKQSKIRIPESIHSPSYMMNYWNDTTFILHNKRSIFEFSLRTHQFRPFDQHPIYKYVLDKNKPIIEIFTDSTQQILIEWHDEWAIAFKDTDEILTIDRKKLGVPITKTAGMLQYHSGTYILTDKNLFFVASDTKKTIALDFDIPKSRATDLGFRNINIYKDTIYIGCVIKGMYKFIRKNQRLELFDHWHSSNYLLSNNVQYAQLRQDSLMWLTCGLGIQVINLNQNSFSEASRAQNIPFLLLDRPLTFNRNGYMLCNTNDYIIWSQEKKFFDNKPPTIILSSFLAHDKEKVAGTSWPENKKIKLSYQENFFQIQISLLKTFGSFPKVRIKLEGFDQDWKNMDESLEQTYTNVPAGDYFLKVESNQPLNKSQVTTLSIPVSIAAPYWQTWWFRLLGAIVVFGIITIIYRIKVNTVRSEEALKTAYNKQLAELEMQRMRSQMNPHFMFNSLNSIKHYILKNEREKASDYLSNFANLIRSILNFSHAQFITLEDEINTLKTYIELEQLRFSKGFDYEITIEDSVNPKEVLVQPLIFQPYIENAIWHGLMHKDQDRMLHLNCKIVAQQLICTIEDNGIGRNKASQIRSKSATKKSYGLQITEARMKSQDASADIVIEDLYNSDGLATGTKVTLILPIKKQPQTTEIT
jgi:two-component sensor histidine kinase